MWDFPKFDFRPMGLYRALIFHLGTKFGAEMLIDAEIMAKNLNSRCLFVVLHQPVKFCANPIHSFEDMGI